MTSNKSPAALNTVAIGVAAALGVVVYSQVGSGETSMAMRIGSGALAFVVAAAVAMGVVALIRKAKK